MWTIAALLLLTRLGGSLAVSVSGIKVDINVPEEAELGHSVDLKCSWKLPSRNSTLYSVKWYKDEHEFFSYNPENSIHDRTKVHPQKGVNVDPAKKRLALLIKKMRETKFEPSKTSQSVQDDQHRNNGLDKENGSFFNNKASSNDFIPFVDSNSQSTPNDWSLSPQMWPKASPQTAQSNAEPSNQFISCNQTDPTQPSSATTKTMPQIMYSDQNLIRLTGLSLNSSGQYKCEVSTGPPFFATNYKQKNLTVIAPPSQGPEITGVTPYYAPGENVTANCTSWPSVPKAKLYWTINNKTVPADYVIRHPELKPIKGQGTPNSLGLRFEMESRQVRGASLLRIRCVGHVGSRRYETERTIQLAHANNQRFSAGDLRSVGSATYASAALVLLLAAALAT